MGFLLLGIDSLIACVAVGPIINQRWFVPFAVLFGICDGGGYLLGQAFHWDVPDSVSNIVQTAVLIALGLYWIGIAVFASRPRVSSSTWLLWLLPFALSIDNITFGLVDDDGSTSGNIWGQAGEQALSSALLAGIGLAIGIALVRAVPSARQHQKVVSGVAGGALIVASGALLLLG
jgi:zinc transporter ZupT